MATLQPIPDRRCNVVGQPGVIGNGILTCSRNDRDKSKKLSALKKFYIRAELPIRFHKCLYLRLCDVPHDGNRNNFVTEWTFGTVSRVGFVGSVGTGIIGAAFAAPQRQALANALMRADSRDSLRDIVLACATPLFAARCISGCA